MFKKLAIIFLSVWVLSIACQKEEICHDNFIVTGFSIKVNDENIGILKDQGHNLPGIINTTRNQLMFVPEQDFNIAQNRTFPNFNFDIIPNAYASRCVSVETSLTQFDPAKTSFSLDIDLPLAWYDISEDTIYAGGNLLENQKLRDGLLAAIVRNEEIHSGFKFPISFTPEFLIPMNGREIGFTLKMTNESGTQMQASTTATISLDI